MLLGMKKGFFDDVRIKFLRRFSNGDKYVMIYIILVGMTEKFGTSDLNVSDVRKELPYDEILTAQAILLLDAVDLAVRCKDKLCINLAGLFVPVKDPEI